MIATLSEIEWKQVEAFATAIPPLVKVDRPKFAGVNHLDKAAVHNAIVARNGAECFLADDMAERIRYLEMEDRLRLSEIAVEIVAVENLWRWSAEITRHFSMQSG